MTGMENVLAAHWSASTYTDQKPFVDKCDGCGEVIFSWGDPTVTNGADRLAKHQAEALAAAGFGNLHDAWAEGHRTPVQRERSDCRCGAWCENECACGKYGTGKIVTPNPYPKVSES